MSSELTDLDAATEAAGDEGTTVEPLWDVGAVLAGAVPIEARMSVLDVATGGGGVATRAARAGAEVVGLAVWPQQLERAARRADAEGVRVEWVEGDLDALPHDDDSFDRVLSAFGVSFAARPDAAASELVRVCRAGGEVVMANWCPQGFGGRLAATLRSHRAPQSSVPVAPCEWGTYGHVRRKLGGQLVLAIEPGSVELVGASTDALLADLEEHLGPLVAAKAQLDPRRYEDLRGELRALVNELDVGAEGQTRVAAPYLLVIGHKPRP